MATQKSRTQSSQETISSDDLCDPYEVFRDRWQVVSRLKTTLSFYRVHN